MLVRIALASLLFILALGAPASADRATAAARLKDWSAQFARVGSIRARHTVRKDPDADRLVSAIAVKRSRFGGWRPIATVTADDAGGVTMKGAGDHARFFAAYQDGAPAAAKLRPHESHDDFTVHAHRRTEHGAELEVITPEAHLGLVIDLREGGIAVTSRLEKRDLLYRMRAISLAKGQLLGGGTSWLTLRGRAGDPHAGPTLRLDLVDRFTLTQ